MAKKADKKSITCDVVVVGAGLVGLATAVALTQHGKRVVLVGAVQDDSTPMDVWDTRIYALTPATQTWLQGLGVWSLVNQTRVNNVEAMSLWGPESNEPLNLLAEDANCPKLACIIENKNLMQALWQKLKATGAQIINDSLCQRVVDAVDAVVLHLENGTEVSAKLLVAADGANSFVRQQLAIPTKVKPFNQLALVANYLAENSHGNIARQWFSSHTTLALLPLPNRHVSMVWSLPMELAQTLLGLTTEALAARVQTESRGTLGWLKPVSHTQFFELRQVTASRFIGDRVVLAGDAAHQVHPMAGQGANLGFRDVVGLERLIAGSHPLQDIGEQAFLRRYERARKADVLSMNTLTTGLDRWFSFESEVLKSVTASGMKQLDKHVSIKKMLIQQAIA